MTFFALSGFAPDVDPTTAGVLTDAVAIISSLRGIKAAPGAVAATVNAVAVAALPAAALGAEQLLLLNGSRRLFAGTNTALYELLPGQTAWTNVSRASPGPYAAVRWRFTQFGNVSIAADKIDRLQFSISAGAFANIVSAPSAAIVETVGEFVLAFNTDHPSFGDRPDSWWCSGIGDFTNWDPSIAAQCATGRLTSIPGPITAGKRLGDRIVVYKDRGIILGTYTGPVFVWSFADIPGDIGAVSQEVVIDLGTSHLFMSRNGFFSFDGVAVVPIDQEVRNWWLARVALARINFAVAVHNRGEGFITWFYPLDVTGTLVEGLVYNYRTGKWGRDNRTVSAVLEYVVSDASSYDALGDAAVTYDALGGAAVTYDALSVISEEVSVPAFFSATNFLFTLDGVAGSWSYVMGSSGDEQELSWLTRITPRFITEPAAPTFLHLFKDALGDAFTVGVGVSYTRNRFDLYKLARWHSGVLAGSGNMEQTGIAAYFEDGGFE